MMMILKMNNFHFLIQYIFNFYSKYIYFFNMVIVIEILFLIIFRKNILYNVSSQIYVFFWRFLKFSILEMNLSMRTVRDVARFWSIQIYFHIIMFFSIKWRYVIIDVFFLATINILFKSRNLWKLMSWKDWEWWESFFSSK
jgi:hypothetical protein